jgi:hypothetical protein
MESFANSFLQRAMDSQVDDDNDLIDCNDDDYNDDERNNVRSTEHVLKVIFVLSFIMFNRTLSLITINQI